MSDNLKGWIYVVIQFLLLGIIIISSAMEFKYLNRPLYPVIHYIGVTLILLGALLFTLILIGFGQFMTPNPVPRDSSKLVTTGLYKYVRHPMYFTVLVLITGVTLYFQAFYSLIWIPVALTFLIIKSKAEEKFLRKKYPEYTEYSAGTKRIIPYIY